MIVGCDAASGASLEKKVAIEDKCIMVSQLCWLHSDIYARRSDLDSMQS